MLNRRDGRVMVSRFPVWMAPVLVALLAGCEGDLAYQLMERDLNSLRSEMAAVSRTNEGQRAFVEERLGKVEADVKGRQDKASQERREDIEGFMRSQATLNGKLDELADQARLTQGRVEEISHTLAELQKRTEALSTQVGQVGRRVDGFEKQFSQAAATIQEAKTAGQTASAAAQEATSLAHQASTASQQTAQEVTNALRQMAEQTNTALQQVSTTTQLALTEARKAGVGKPTPPPALVKLPPPISASSPPASTPSTPVASPAPPAPAPSAVAPAPAPVQPTPPHQAAATESPGDLYKNALNEYTKGHYDLAIEGFRRYIAGYPRTGLAPNAQYWLGESLYGRKNYSQAIKEFDLFLKDYPNHPKVAGALLKQGYAYVEISDTARARTAFNAVVKRFPRSSEAKSAKTRLSHLKKASGGKSAGQTAAKRAP